MAKVLCMEIGVISTRIVEMDYQAKKPRVYRCIEVKTPEDAVTDGYLNQEKQTLLQENIKEALTQNKIRTKRVIFTVFSGKIINREIILPAVKPHQINAVIESNVTEYFPVELEDYKLTHMLLKTFREGENSGKHKVLVIAAEKSLLAGYDELATKLGLRLVDIDYAGNSLLQATRHSAGAEAIMVIKVESENAIISIIRQGSLILQRNINHAINRPGNMDLTQEEAAEALVSTMMRVMDFYTSQDEGNSIEQIYICGEDSQQKNLLAMIESQTGITCRPVDTVRGVVIHKNVQDMPLDLFAAAIGAGIASVGFANEKENERNETNYVNASLLMIILCIVLVLTVLSLSVVPYNMEVMRQNELARKEEMYADAKVVHDRYLGTQDLFNQIDYGNRLTMNSNDSILDFLSELEEKLPSDVEVSEFTSNDSQCVITLRVADKETAAGVIDCMRGFESICDVSVESVVEESALESDDKELNSDNTTAVFTLTCTYLVSEIQQPVMNNVATETDSTQTTVQE